MFDSVFSSITQKLAWMIETSGIRFYGYRHRIHASECMQHTPGEARRSQFVLEYHRPFISVSKALVWFRGRVDHQTKNTRCVRGRGSLRINPRRTLGDQCGCLNSSNAIRGGRSCSHNFRCEKRRAQWGEPSHYPTTLPRPL